MNGCSEQHNNSSRRTQEKTHLAVLVGKNNIKDRLPVDCDMVAQHFWCHIAVVKKNRHERVIAVQGCCVQSRHAALGVNFERGITMSESCCAVEHVIVQGRHDERQRRILFARLDVDLEKASMLIRGALFESVNLLNAILRDNGHIQLDVPRGCHQQFLKLLE